MAKLDLTALSPLVLVGAGNMGGAMLAGWMDQGADPSSITVIDPVLRDDVSACLSDHGIAHLASPDAFSGQARLLLIAVKPQIMAMVLPTLVNLVDDKTILMSVAAGTTIATLTRWLCPGATVRVMPNTPAQVARGMSVAVFDRALQDDVKAGISGLLSAIGQVAWVDDEAQIDAVTGLSGSGPAYVFHMVEALASAGVEAGLAPELAMALARQTVAGAGELLYRSDQEASQLRTNVTSPGGTTAAGLDVLMNERDGLTSLLTRTVAAATGRSRELARE